MRTEAVKLASVLRPALLAVGACAALAGLANATGYGFAYQPTDSMPHGLYLLTPAAHATKGSLVTLAAPGKPGLTLLKRIAANGGDEVCIRGREVFIAGRPAAEAAADGPPPATLCRSLTEGEVFLLGDGPRSFDSRYFGPVERSALRHRAVPL
ncbi:S26 family signal peptidase [Lacibacterium aquatile]|uniref:signal peptidase I n=1 Tax=Lacibacterium aquatile TaxID=1168082 RepID=A0ABW5DKW7_9PROT